MSGPDRETGERLTDSGTGPAPEPPAGGVVPGVAGGLGLRFVPALRLAADPAALDAAPTRPGWPPAVTLARVAPDDAIVLLEPDAGSAATAPADPGPGRAGVHTSDWAAGDWAAGAVAAVVTGLDPFALVEPETGLVGVSLELGLATRWVARHADWLLDSHHDAAIVSDGPAGRVAQGLVAGVPVKIVVGADRALVLVPTAYAAELAERWEDPGPGEGSQP